MESTLSLRWTDLQGEAGDYLGWGRGTDNGEEAWTTQKTREIDSQVKSGLRMFYQQAQLRPDDPVHNWSFLAPLLEVTLPADDQYAALPDDFGGLEGPITVRVTGLTGFNPIELDNFDAIRLRYDRFPDASGRPQVAGLEALRGTSPAAGSRNRLWIYPQADTEYTLRVRYYILPDMMTAAQPYPYGGAGHAETMKAAVRAACEMYMDNKQGLEWGNYVRSLAASIAFDRKKKPQVLGYNGDRSDGMLYEQRPIDFTSHVITIAGIDPSL